ncbi:GNAT family N-acetyltransferase [Tumebacillus permanentifrigoris]|uniref:Acetyltransferase (GNAT) family protein n=1 Tax=Tumebacillus permanentifrigoris TaxID=378543 RepID=A0A316DCP8_9BACL|nr:GNAT family N-acetyltransferase [Tumebacillus permanentifrigoris]PWK15508.1 acetyltransferase (GNAT) family protein [Tumebacillus permanentifrigoris]
MIRQYRASDHDAVVQLVRSNDPHMHPQEIQQLLAQGERYVCSEKGEIKGCALVIAHRSPLVGKTCELFLLTALEQRKRGIGRALWAKAWPAVLATDSDVVTAQYRLDAGDTRAFFAKRGFERWLSMHQMQYSGPPFPEPDVTARHYEDRDFAQYIELLSAAYYDLRRKNDCQPYALTESVTPQSRRLVEQHAEFIYVFTAGEELIGSFAIKGPAEIDDLFVAPSHQGRGMGRRITQFAVNRLLERGADPVTLTVVTTNKRAYELYLDVGFQLVQTSEISRMAFTSS